MTRWKRMWPRLSDNAASRLRPFRQDLGWRQLRAATNRFGPKSLSAFVPPEVIDWYEEAAAKSSPSV